MFARLFWWFMSVGLLGFVFHTIAVVMLFLGYINPYVSFLTEIAGPFTVVGALGAICSCIGWAIWGRREAP